MCACGACVGEALFINIVDICADVLLYVYIGITMLVYFWCVASIYLSIYLCVYANDMLLQIKFQIYLYLHLYTLTLSLSLALSLYIYIPSDAKVIYYFENCPDGWGCRIHCLLLCRGLRPLHQQVSWIWHETIWWWGSGNFRALGNAEYPFIAITPKSTLAQSGNTW